MAPRSASPGVLSLLWLLWPGLAGAGPAQETDLFVSGSDGYHTFRIPALLVTPKGTLLAFAEGRRRGTSDSGDIDLVLRRSLDGGETWLPLEVVADDGPNTIGNPCPVADRETGTTWLPVTRNLGEDSEEEIVARTGKGTREVWLLKSTDGGSTWAERVEITSSAKDPSWTWYATGEAAASSSGAAGSSCPATTRSRGPGCAGRT